jgi:hypothetical protein
MAVRARISLEHVEDVVADTATCIVRCLEGTVSVGDVFNVATSANGAAVTVSMRVVRIWRYGRVADLLDPPHTAKLELASQDVGLLPGLSLLAVSRSE